MARKKRRFEQLQAAATATADTKDKPLYKDTFQETVGSKLENVGKSLEGKGRTLLYGLAALVVLLIAFGIYYTWNKRSEAAAQAALGKAIETSTAVITDAPPPAGSNEKTFKTERERADAAINEFQAVVDKYGGSVGEKAKYFIAINRLSVDRAAGISELEALGGSNTESGKLAKFALAQTKAADGKTDEAVALYQELAGMSDPVVSKDSINMELAKLYEKQGKNKEAADIYFDIANNAAQAKDSEGKPIPMSQTARDAKDSLEKLDPDRAKQIQEPSSDSPFGGQVQ